MSDRDPSHLEPAGGRISNATRGVLTGLAIFIGVLALGVLGLAAYGDSEGTENIWVWWLGGLGLAATAFLAAVAALTASRGAAVMSAWVGLATASFALLAVAGAWISAEL